MSAEQNFSPDEYELLSAYLDDMLNEAERTALELRLVGDDALYAELEALRNTVSLIKTMPTLKAPRNFTLTPAMVKSRTEPSTPSMVKSRTEPGRVIRFPISTAMSAAASFIFIIIGLLLLTSGKMLPNATPSIDEGAENRDVAMQLEQREMLPTDTQIVTEEIIEQEADDMDAVSQPAMPTPTLFVGATQQAYQPQAPAPMALDMTATMTAEAFAEAVPAMAFGLTTDVTPEAMDVMPPVDVAAQEPITDITIMSIVTSPETPAMQAVIEIMDNAIPPSETPDTLVSDEDGGVTAFAITPTPDVTIIATVADSTPSTNITTLIGLGLVIIGVLVFIVTLWRWRKE